MMFQRIFFSLLLVQTVMVSFFVPPAETPGIIAAPLIYRHPNVNRNMEKAEFWIRKLSSPSNLLLSSENIRKMNEENLKRKDLLICRVKDLKENWTRDEIISFLDEDWGWCSRSAKPRYGRNGKPHSDFLWNRLKRKINLEAIPEHVRMRYAFIVVPSELRVFPTYEVSLSMPKKFDSDRFQHSSITPGSPVGIYHFSREKDWAYVQAGFARGWVRTKALAITGDRRAIEEFEAPHDRVVVTGDDVEIFGDSCLRKLLYRAQMGDSFPFVGKAGESASPSGAYIILVPIREKNGRFAYQKGFIREKDDVYRGFLPFTQENVARQAFKMLDHPFGLGDICGGRDCSRFTMDIFKTFGIMMPRCVSEQSKIGIDVPLGEVKTEKEKEKILDGAIPLATILGLQRHVMVYLGEDRGRHYVIHSTILSGKVVVSELGLGKKWPGGSLLKRLKVARVIGEK